MFMFLRFCKNKKCTFCKGVSNLFFVCVFVSTDVTVWTRHKKITLTLNPGQKTFCLRCLAICLGIWFNKSFFLTTANYTTLGLEFYTKLVSAITQRGRQKAKKSQQKLAKAHTKIAADAQNLRKNSKSQQKHIQKSPRAQKTQENPRKISKSQQKHVQKSSRAPKT